MPSKLACPFRYQLAILTHQFFFKFQCLANSDHPKLNISREGDTVNLVGQAVNKNLKNDAHLTFFTSSLPKIRWAMADESGDKRVKTEENFKDVLKEYERRKKIEISQKFSQFYCKLCNVQSTSLKDLTFHRAGKNHQRNLKITNLAEKISKNKSKLRRRYFIGRRLLQIKDTAPLLN